MILKSCLKFVLLFETLSASQIERQTPQITYQALVKRIKEECSYNDWHDGVLKYYEGCTKTGQSYPGPTNQAQPVLSAFEVFLNKLLDLTTSNSTILSSRSTAILDAMSKLSKVGGSYGNLFSVATSVLPQLSIDLKEVVSSVSENVGRSTTDLMNNAITDLVQSILQFAFTFQKCGVEHFGNGFASKANYESVTKSVQMLMNVLALVIEITINNCNIGATKMFESLTALTLIAHYFLIGAHSFNVVAQAILQTASQEVPDTMHASLVCLAPFLELMAEPIGAIDKTVENDVLLNVLQRFVNVIVSFNTKMEDLFGPFDGVSVTVGQITDSLLAEVTEVSF